MITRIGNINRHYFIISKYVEIYFQPEQLKGQRLSSVAYRLTGHADFAYMLISCGNWLKKIHRNIWVLANFIGNH